MDDVFYLPHNLDFRGRAYPLPPHLNHMGNDLSRGLLLFAKAKPLGTYLLLSMFSMSRMLMRLAQASVVCDG